MLKSGMKSSVTRQHHSSLVSTEVLLPTSSSLRLLPAPLLRQQPYSPPPILSSLIAVFTFDSFAYSSCSAACW